MRKVIVFLAVCGLLASAATCVFAEDQPARVKPDLTQQLIKLKPASGTLTVNDFHIRFKGAIQTTKDGTLQWLHAQLSDVDQSQIYCSTPSIKEMVANDGWLELNFTFANTVLTPTQGMNFGFALKGGVDVTDYKCWWTLDGANVRSLPKIMPVAKVEANRPKMPVKSLREAAVPMARAP